MKTSNASLTFESVNEILWCDHSVVTSFAVLSLGTICFSIFFKTKFRMFLEFWFWTLLGVKGLNLSGKKSTIRLNAFYNVQNKRLSKL